MKKLVFFIDKQKIETTEEQLSVRQIMKLGNIDSGNNVLVLKKGMEELTDLDRMIELKNGMHFTVFSTEQNPVS